MPPPSPRETEALAALERLHERKLVTREQAQAAARLITRDPQAAFPPSRPEAAPPAAVEPTEERAPETP